VTAHNPRRDQRHSSGGQGRAKQEARTNDRCRGSGGVSGQAGKQHVGLGQHEVEAALRPSEQVEFQFVPPRPHYVKSRSSQQRDERVLGEVEEVPRHIQMNPRRPEHACLRAARVRHRD